MGLHHSLLQSINKRKTSRYIETQAVNMHRLYSSSSRFLWAAMAVWQGEVLKNNLSNIGSIYLEIKCSGVVFSFCLNGGLKVQIEWINGGGSLEINGKSYILRQCHWHSPSEHTLYGKRLSVLLTPDTVQTLKCLPSYIFSYMKFGAIFM